MGRVFITEVRNGIYLSDDHTDFNCEINHPQYGWIEYTAQSDDDDYTIDNEALRTLLGSNIAPYVGISTEQQLYEEQISTIRDKRDGHLVMDVDPLVSNPLRWNALTSEKQAEWINYRNLLLDVPQQETFPDSVEWPNKPD